MSDPRINLTPEDKERIHRDIDAARRTLAELVRFERIGQDVSEQRKRLEKTIIDNEAILKEFGS